MTYTRNFNKLKKMDDRTITHPLWGFEEPSQIEPVDTNELEEIETKHENSNSQSLQYLIGKAYQAADMANNFVAAYESGNCGRAETLQAVTDFHTLMNEIRNLVK